MDNNKCVFIVWQRVEKEFVDRKYVGNGEFDAIFRDVTITKGALWSSEATTQNIAAAEEYIKENMTDRPGAQVELLAWEDRPK